MIFLLASYIRNKQYFKRKVIACRIRFECILLWNLGYALYFAGKIAGDSLSGIKNRIGKILVFILLLTVSVPGVVFLCIPSLLLCRIHSLRNPEYARDLPVCTAEKIRLENAAWYRNCNCFYLEGTVEEDALKKTAFLQNWQLKEIQTPFTIAHTAKTMIDFHSGKSQQDSAGILVRSGLFHQEKNPVKPAGITIVWDRKTKRLYLSRIFR